MLSKIFAEIFFHGVIVLPMPVWAQSPVPVPGSASQQQAPVAPPIAPAVQPSTPNNSVLPPASPQGVDPTSGLNPVGNSLQASPPPVAPSVAPKSNSGAAGNGRSRSSGHGRAGGNGVSASTTPPTSAPILFQGSERLMNPAFGESMNGDEDRLFKNIDYPELQVVPRASERLAYEAQAERDQKLSFFWTLQIPAVASIAAGWMTYQKYTTETMSDQLKRDHDAASLGAVGTGLLWLGIDFYLMASEPYNEALGRINKIKKGDRKNDLLRERIAEEAMEKTARTMRTLNTLSILTNSILIFATLPGTKDELRPLVLLPFALAFTPYVFPQKYVDIYEKHQEYKRKIYAPVSYFDLRINQKTGNLEPITGLVWNF